MKWVGELHSLSISPTCLRWAAVCAEFTLWPNTAYLPKVLLWAHQNKPLRLARFVTPPSEKKTYLETYSTSAPLKLFIRLISCSSAATGDAPFPRQRLSHWIVGAILHGYRAEGCLFNSSAIPCGGSLRPGCSTGRYLSVQKPHGLRLILSIAFIGSISQPLTRWSPTSPQQRGSLLLLVCVIQCLSISSDSQ